METKKKLTSFILITSMIFLSGCMLFGGNEDQSSDNSAFPTTTEGYENTPSETQSSAINKQTETEETVTQKDSPITGAATDTTIDSNINQESNNQPSTVVEEGTPITVDNEGSVTLEE